MRFPSRRRQAHSPIGNSITVPDVEHSAAGGLLMPTVVKIPVSSVHGARTRVSENNMKKVRKPQRKKQQLPDIDFAGGVRGKYAARFAEGTKLVALSPDVAEIFPDSEAVNEALRTLT